MTLSDLPLISKMNRNENGKETRKTVRSVRGKEDASLRG